MCQRCYRSLLINLVAFTGPQLWVTASLQWSCCLERGLHVASCSDSGTSWACSTALLSQGGCKHQHLGSCTCSAGVWRGLDLNVKSKNGCKPFGERISSVYVWTHIVVPPFSMLRCTFGAFVLAYLPFPSPVCLVFTTCNFNPPSTTGFAGAEASVLAGSFSLWQRCVALTPWVSDVASENPAQVQSYPRSNGCRTGDCQRTQWATSVRLVTFPCAAGARGLIQFVGLILSAGKHSHNKVTGWETLCRTKSPRTPQGVVQTD